MQGKCSKETPITTGDIDEFDELEEQVAQFACLLVLVSMILLSVFGVILCLAIVVTHLVMGIVARLGPAWIGNQST